MRKTFLKRHLSNEDLKKRYETSVDNKIRKRWHMLWLVQELDYSAKDASIAVGQGKSFGQYWIKQYNEKGSSAIVIPKLRNPYLAKKKVTDEMKIDLLERLKANPFDEIGGGLWSGPKVFIFLNYFYGVKISRNKGWYLLKECDQSLTSIRHRHRKSSKEDKEDFKKIN